MSIISLDKSMEPILLTSAKPIFLTLTSLMKALQATSAEPANLMYKAQICLNVCK